MTDFDAVMIIERSDSGDQIAAWQRMAAARMIRNEDARILCNLGN